LKRFGKEALNINATGGGAFKHADLIKEKTKINFIQRDEMESLVQGLNFLLSNETTQEEEIFTYSHIDKEKKYVSFKNGIKYPYLLVQIGSGVSMILVEGYNKYKRVTGSSFGGGTFNAICKLVSGKDSFEEWIELSKKGDNNNVDLLVGDIYGGDYTNIPGLKKTTIASSLAKVCSKEEKDYK
jgi:pantothenate kinase